MRKSHSQATLDKATELYFKIEQHFAQGGESLLLREVQAMLGIRSKSTALVYVNILEEWGLIKHHAKVSGGIVLAKTNYPPVVYGTPTDHTEPLQFPRN